MRKSGDGRVEITKARLNLCKHGFGVRLVHCVVGVIGHSALRLVQRALLVTETGISERESIGQSLALRNDDEIGRGLDRLNCPRKGGMRFVRPTGPFLAVAKLRKEAFRR